MSLEKQFAKLKKMEQFQVNKDWQASTKHEIMSEIHSQTRLMKAQQLSASERFDLFAMRLTRRLMPSMTKVIAGALIIVMSSGTAFAAQESVPGQALYPIKRSLEKSELVFAFSSVHETEVHIKHLNKRLEEINKIVEKSKTSDAPEKLAKNEKAIKQVVQHLEKEAASVDQTLKIVKEDAKPLEVVNLAKKVKEATKEAKKQVDVLEDQVAQAGRSVVLKEALTSVKTINEEVNQTAVDVAVQVHEDIVAAKGVKETQETLDNYIDQDKKVIDDQEIAAVTQAVVELITEDIADLNSEIQVSQEKTDIVSKENIAEAVVSANIKSDAVATGDVVKVEAKDIEELKAQPQAAAATLLEAKTLLEGGSLKDAAAKVAETKKIQQKTDTVLKNIEKVVEENKISNPVKTEASPTSTKPVVNPVNIQVSSTTIEKAMFDEGDLILEMSGTVLDPVKKLEENDL